MKPDWKDAPEWANWLAMDGNGWWFWFKFEPWWGGDLWLDESLNSEDYQVAQRPSADPSDWKDAVNTKEPRP